MTDIYDEVVADRKKLLEVAENNAKNKILDAVTPRIKELVESALLGKLNEELSDDDILLDLEGIPSDESMGPADPGMPANPIVDAEISIDTSTSPLPTPVPDVAAGEDAGVTLPGPDGKVVLDIDSFLADSSAAPASTKQFELTPESMKALNALVGNNVCDLNVVNERIIKLEGRLRKLTQKTNPTANDIETARQIKLECEKHYSDIQASREVLDEARAVKAEKKLETIYNGIMENYSAAGHIKTIVAEMMSINKRAAKFNKQILESRGPTYANTKAVAGMLQEVKDLHSIVGNLYTSLGKDDSIDEASVHQVGANLATLYTEIRKMVTKKRKQINEADELEVGADVMGAGEEPDADVDANEVLVQLKLPASLDDLAGGDSVEVVGVEPAAGDDMDMDMDDMDMDDMEMDDESDVEGLDDMGVEEEPEMAESKMYEARLNDDDIIEIDEAALVAEMKKMKQLQEKKKVGTAGIKNVNTGGHGPAHFDSFGGGKEEGDLFVDGEDLNAHDPVGSEGYLDESADLEGLAEEDESMDEGDCVEEEEEVKSESRRVKASRTNGKSQKQLAEAFEKARAELAGQKLFNTKLVALNRVLQFPGLKQSQKEKIVETLDRGRTVAEVKELYGKIVTVLKKQSQKSMNESAQGTGRGSASRVVTSGAATTDKDSPLLERWQKIAFGGSGLIQG